jgi:signal transduction histidine kinase
VRSRSSKKTRRIPLAAGNGAAPQAAAEALPQAPAPGPVNGRADGAHPDSGHQVSARHGGAGSRRGLKNWRVRSRLVLLIAIPTLTALVLGGVSIASSFGSALADGRIEQLAKLSTNITNLAQGLENERDQTVYFIGLGTKGGRTDALSHSPKISAEAAPEVSVIKQEYTATNQSATEVTAQLRQIGSSFSTQAQQEAATALTVLRALPALREAAASTQLPPLVVVQKYTQLIQDLQALEDETSQGSSDATLSQTVRVLGLVSAMKEEASEQRAILAGALLQGQLSAGALAALDSALADQQSNLQSFNTSSTVAQRQLWANSVSSSFVYLASSEELQAISTAQANNNSLVSDTTTPDDWYGAMSNAINFQMGSVERTLAGQVSSRAGSLRNSALLLSGVVGLAVVLVLALALGLTVIVGRSMVRPLRRLRAGALEVAGVRLPDMVRRMSETDGAGVPLEVEPIDVDSSDEIGEVARAFDQVHREALRLAANEAALRGNVNAMFVNLSRRSQSLVERQIRLIDDLEQGEQDAERLSNLFQMDHLATRMRRNSENLLVLAGHDASRRWNQPVALVDVLRAAISEIEQYERVSLNVQPGIAVRGPAVNDVVHLIAELAENATSFSSAETPVAVSGHLLNSGGVLLDISDQGVGMGAEEMAHANWRLDNPPVVDVAVSRRMGLFVVARLAARHGIRVRLRPAPTGGLTALVWLPDEVVTHEMVGSSPGTRRFERNAPGSVDLPSTVGPFATEWPAGDRTATEQAVTAARAPRFTPLRAENGDGAAAASPKANSSWEGSPPTSPIPSVPDTGRPFSDTGRPELPVFGAPVNGGVDEQVRPSSRPDTSFGAEASPPRRSDTSFGAEASPPRREVVVPPPADTGHGNRLPIFESVESDWFRRGKHSTETAAPAAESVPSWTSAGDEGWRAAEAVHTPTSGGVTLSGLPKRVPKANLVPGTAGGGDTASPAPSIRSASVTRDRFASFQRGVRDGRAALNSDDDPGGEEDGVG